jgi:uncharacterized membrane protein YheB (UPF0754 family)
MLFRPFKPHWYTLGWQGIIPRTRKALAANIARVVGDRLVTAEEIDATIKEPQIQQKLENEAMQAFASEALWGYANNFISNGLPQILADKENAHRLDSASASALSMLAEHLGSVKAQDILAKAKSLNAPELQKHLGIFFRKAIDSYIHRFIRSGGSIYELTGTINTAELARVAVESMQPSFTEFFSSPGMVDTVSDALIRYKNEQFKSNTADKMKLGMLNIFFSDGKIKELVNEKLPGIGGQLASDQKLRVQLNIFLVGKLDELIATPIQKFASQMESSKYYSTLHKISHGLAAKLAPEELLNGLSETLLKNTDPDITLQELLQKEHINLGELMPRKLPLSTLLQSPDAKVIAFGGLATLRSWLTTAENSEKTAKLAVSMGTDLLEKALPAFLGIIDISGLVEKKVNSLEMRQVEDLLFAFMKSHFKWINLLGFIIGFLVGLGQLGFMLYKAG